MGKFKSGETECTIGDSWTDGQYLKVDTGEIITAAVTGGAGGGIVYDTQANRPAAGTQGREFIPTDGYGPTRQIDNGVSWDNYYSGLKCMDLPGANTFTSVNTDDATLVDNAEGVIATLMGTNSSSEKCELYLVSVPSAPYSFSVGIQMIDLYITAYSKLGICLTNSTSDPGIIWYGIMTAPSDIYMNIQKCSNLTTWNSNYVEVAAPPAMLCGTFFLKITDDNTNRNFWISSNGSYYYKIYSGSRTDYITPTHCGIFLGQSINSVATNIIRAKAQFFHWSLG